VLRRWLDAIDKIGDRKWQNILATAQALTEPEPEPIEIESSDESDSDPRKAIIPSSP
jgi:hypothetical protein